MIDSIIGIPLSYIDLRECYIRSHNLRESKKNRVTIELQKIIDWISSNHCTLLSKWYYNKGSGKMVKYYVIERVS